MRATKNTFNKISNWMDQMRLKLNIDKTEYIQFGSRQQLNKIDTTTPFNADGDFIQISNVIRYLAGYMDCNLNFKDLITKNKESDDKPHKNNINQKNHLNGSLHGSSTHAVHMPPRLWKFSTLQTTQKDNRKIPAYTEHIC